MEFLREYRVDAWRRDPTTLHNPMLRRGARSMVDILGVRRKAGSTAPLGGMRSARQEP